MAMPTLVALGRGWTPEEAARHEAALFRALSSDKKALRVYLQKVVEGQLWVPRRQLWVPARSCGSCGSRAFFRPSVGPCAF